MYLTDFYLTFIMYSNENAHIFNEILITITMLALALLTVIGTTLRIILWFIDLMIRIICLVVNSYNFIKLKCKTKLQIDK